MSDDKITVIVKPDAVGQMDVEVPKHFKDIRYRNVSARTNDDEVTVLFLSSHMTIVNTELVKFRDMSEYVDRELYIQFF